MLSIQTQSRPHEYGHHLVHTIHNVKNMSASVQHWRRRRQRQRPNDGHRVQGYPTARHSLRFAAERDAFKLFRRTCCNIWHRILWYCLYLIMILARSQMNSPLFAFVVCMKWSIHMNVFQHICCTWHIHIGIPSLAEGIHLPNKQTNIHSSFDRREHNINSDRLQCIDRLAYSIIELESRFVVTNHSLTLRQARDY